MSSNRLFIPRAERPLALLAQCPAYQETALVESSGLARELGLAEVLVKDESTRMGLGSFKALGGAYAIARMIMDGSGADDPTSEIAREHAAGLTFITASAGNHGLSVAAGARVFGARAVIVLSEHVPEAFADRIRGFDAEVLRCPGNYEASVALAMDTASENDWLLLADGSWPGYTERPALIMEGYTVLAEECRREFNSRGNWPSHLFLQAGVGGLAAAVAAHAREHWAVQPRIIVVEPEAAPCLGVSAARGQLTTVEGGVSNMGRLDCKDASLVALDSLSRDADQFVTITDEQAETAAQDFGRVGLPTTPSGGAGLAAARLQAGQGELPDDARVLLILSEGPES